MSRQIMNEVARIEAQLPNLGVDLKDFLYMAEIDFSLWWRWKRGDVTPRRYSFQRAVTTFIRLEEEHRHGKTQGGTSAGRHR